MVFGAIFGINFFLTCLRALVALETSKRPPFFFEVLTFFFTFFADETLEGFRIFLEFLIFFAIKTAQANMLLPGSNNKFVI